MQNGRINIVIGAQGENVGKSLISTHLAASYRPGALFWVSTPTHPLPPVAALTDCPIYLGRGSRIDPDELGQELEKSNIAASRINIDARACLLNGEIASNDPTLLSIRDLNLHVDTAMDMSTMLDWGEAILFQSQADSVAQAMADSELPPARCGTVWAVCRPFPTSRSSTPFCDSDELMWVDVAKECGYTGPMVDFAPTPPMKVFTFGWVGFARWCGVNRPSVLCLTNIQQLSWFDAGVGIGGGWSLKTKAFVGEMELAAARVMGTRDGARVGLVCANSVDVMGRR